MKKAVLLDSSVIIAAMGSESGGSHRILQYCHDNQIKGFINSKVLKEISKRANKVNFPEADIKKFLLWSNLIVLPHPTDAQIQQFSRFTPDPKDVHLLATANRIPNCSLISLDKKHILSIKSKDLGIKILSPGEFLQAFVSTEFDHHRK